MLRPLYSICDVRTAVSFFFFHHRASAQNGFNPCDNLAVVERLGNIIVRADFQPQNAVVVVILRRQHNNGDIAHFADLFADFQPVHYRHHNIQNDNIGLFGLHF